MRNALLRAALLPVLLAPAALWLWTAEGPFPSPDAPALTVHDGADLPAADWDAWGDGGVQPVWLGGIPADPEAPLADGATGSTADWSLDEMLFLPCDRGGTAAAAGPLPDAAAAGGTGGTAAPPAGTWVPVFLGLAAGPNVIGERLRVVSPPPGEPGPPSSVESRGSRLDGDPCQEAAPASPSSATPERSQLGA